MDTNAVIEFIQKYVTKENLTFLLGAFGSIGTLYTLLAQRQKFSLSIQNYRYKNKSLLLYVTFTNHSRLPISILDISIAQNNICYPCVHIPTVVCEHTRRSGKEIVSHREEFSVQFPISLSSLAGSSGYLYFDRLPENYPDDATTLTVQVSTNRGRAKKMRLLNLQ